MEQERRIGASEVRHIARLARLALSDEELEGMGRDLDAILGYVEQLQGLELEGVAPTTHAVPLDILLREDVVVKTLGREEVLSNAPATEEGMFRVPKTVEGGNA